MRDGRLDSTHSSILLEYKIGIKCTAGLLSLDQPQWILEKGVGELGQPGSPPPHRWPPSTCARRILLGKPPC